MMYEYFLRIGFLVIKHNEEGKYIHNEIHNEIFNNIPHFIKNCLHVNCLQELSVMYNDILTVFKWEVIPKIPDHMIPVYCCKNNEHVINFTADGMRYKFEAISKIQNGCILSNWKHTKRMSRNTRLILWWSRYTLFRWFLFLLTMAVWILRWNLFGSGYLKFLSHVGVRTTQTGTKILHSTFICAPCKTL